MYGNDFWAPWRYWINRESCEWLYANSNLQKSIFCQYFVCFPIFCHRSLCQGRDRFHLCGKKGNILDLPTKEMMFGRFLLLKYLRSIDCEISVMTFPVRLNQVSLPSCVNSFSKESLSIQECLNIHHLLLLFKTMWGLRTVVDARVK